MFRTQFVCMSIAAHKLHACYLFADYCGAYRRDSYVHLTIGGGPIQNVMFINYYKYM